MELLKIANKEFESRLFVGTGKFASNALMADAIAASGTQMVTVALRRVDIENENDDMPNEVSVAAEHLRRKRC
jgi:thiazole synthase